MFFNRMFKFRPEKRYSAWPWPLTHVLRGAGCSHRGQQELGTRPHRGAGGSRPSSPAQMVPTKGHGEAELSSARPPLPQPHRTTHAQKGGFSTQNSREKGAGTGGHSREAAEPRSPRGRFTRRPLGIFSQKEKQKMLSISRRFQQLILPSLMVDFMTKISC